MLADGASIPDYTSTSGDAPSEADEEMALWAVLYTDPWYEMRLLGNWPSDEADLAPGQIPTSNHLKGQIESFVPSAELSRLLADFDLRPHFDAAWAVSIHGVP